MIHSVVTISRVVAFAVCLNVLWGGTVDAHIVVTPSGRMGASDAAKFIQNNSANPVVADSPSPCSTFTTPMTTRLQLQAGQDFTFTVQETINHPGRFIIQFRQDPTQNFWTPGPANQLARVEDPLNRGTTPITIKVPNVTCDNCMIRVLQQMDEQPGEFYVHCYDVRISATGPVATPPPATGTEGKSSASNVTQKPGFGGCGTISQSDGPKGPGGGGMASVATWVMLLMPILLAFQFRRRFKLQPA